MKLKLQAHNDLTKNLAHFTKSLNALPLNKTAETYLNSVPLSAVDTSAMLAKYKRDIAAKLPNYQTYLSVGIDLSIQIPTCVVTEAAIDSVVTVRDGFTLYVKLQPFISYDSKAGAFVVNATGNAAIEATVISLTSGQEKIYNAVQSLYLLLSEHNLNQSILSGELINPITKAINLNTLVYEITRKVK